MAGIIRYYYNEKNEDVYEASTFDSFKIKTVNNILTIFVKTSDKLYKFQLTSDTRWQNRLDLMIDFLNKNFEKVLLGEYCCKIDTFEDRIYVFFRFFENFENDCVVNGQFTGFYVK